MKSRLVEANADRLAGIESGETTVVGVNRYEMAEESPLTSGPEAIMVADRAAEADQIARLDAWRATRDADAVEAALSALRAAMQDGSNVMPPSIAAAKAGVTTGEWGAAIRAAFGQYRAPTGVARTPSNRTEGLDEIRQAVDAVSDNLGRRLKFLIGKPGLDGHSNGAEQIATRARDCGMDIVYDGIRLTPEEIVENAKGEGVHVIGLSILSGSHIPLIEELMERLEIEGLSDVPVIVGGIIPDADCQKLEALGVRKVYTPKDFELNKIMMDVVSLLIPDEIAAQ
jgi:(2R)-ethylmalonyl-CoA mutase